MDVDAYLARIGARAGDPLTSLHAAHVGAVPFEDYDIHRGVALSLAADDLFDKIVRRGRGGFCYELNGLFGMLLSALGHDVVLVSAFFVDGDGVRGADYEHLRLVVDGEWLADVGNGARWRAPVPFRVGEHGPVRVQRDGELWWTCAPNRDGDWERDWGWTMAPRRLDDFRDRCRFQEHDPESHFRRNRMASLALPNGRISLVDGVFAETGQPERRVDPEEERTILAERFGIVVDGWASIGRDGTPNSA